MGPGRYGGLGATVGAAAAALAVALGVLAMVSLGGGVRHPLVASASAVAPAQAAHAQG